MVKSDIATEEARVRKSVRTFVLVFPGLLLEKGERRRGKSFSPGILVSLGRGWRNEEEVRHEGEVVPRKLLDFSRVAATTVSLRGNGGHEFSFSFFFFFSFFGYRETCNFGTQLETSGLNFYIFGLSIETFLFRFAKFLTRSRASTVSIRERKMRKMYRDTMHLVHSCNFSKFSKENEPDFQMWSNYESLYIFL